MGRNLVITARHALGIAGVKAKVSERFGVLKNTYMDRIGAAELAWDGEVGHAWATALGQKGTAVVTAGEQDLRIEIALPWLLAPMAGMLQAIIEANADAIKPGPAAPASPEAPAPEASAASIAA